MLAMLELYSGTWMRKRLPTKSTHRHTHYHIILLFSEKKSGPECYCITVYNKKRETQSEKRDKEPRVSERDGAILVHGLIWMDPSSRNTTQDGPARAGRTTSLL